MEDLAVVDWSTRESTRSSVRIFVKKLFLVFKIEGLGSQEVDGIVHWFAEQLPEMIHDSTD